MIKKINIILALIFINILTHTDTRILTEFPTLNKYLGESNSSILHIQANAYSIMNKNPKIFYDLSSLQLTLFEKNSLLTRITQEDFTVGYISRPLEQIGHLPYLSGDDLHYFVALPLEKSYICLAIITSTNDGHTHRFGDKQYANRNIQEKDKAEYCRPLTYLTYIDEDTLFVPSEEHSVLINKSFYNNTKIKDIFINAIKENAIEWKNNPIRKPISFTMNRLNNLAIIFCENNLNSWENTNNKLKHKLNWDELNETEKQDEILTRSKQEQTVLVEKRKSAYRKLLPEDIKPFFDTKEKLLLEKNKLNKEAHNKKNTLNNDESKFSK